MKKIQTKLIRIKGIVGLLYRNFDEGVDSLVVFAKGAPNIPDDGPLVDAETILDFKVNLFVPDYIGYGKSDGTFTPVNCIKTFLDSYNYFREIYRKVYFIGFSFGGAFLSLLPRFNPEIKNICLISPILDYQSQGKFGGEETVDDFVTSMKKDGYKHLYRGILSTGWINHFNCKDDLYPLKNIKYLGRTKLFIAHGRKDKTIHFSKSVDYYKKIIKSFPGRAKNIKLKLYPNGDHSFRTRRLAIRDYFVFAGVRMRGIKDSEVIRLQKKYLLQTYADRDVSFIYGSGIYLISKDGKKYLDMLSNYGVNILGYGNKKLEHILNSQLNNLPTLHCSMATEIRARAAAKLFQLIPTNLTRVFFSNSGTEAVEAAIKFAVFYTKRKKFIAAKKSYHGKTLGSFSATDSVDKFHKKLFQGMLLDFKFVNFGDIEDLKNKISEEVACVILEPIQGQGGINPAPTGYLQQVKTICKKYGSLLVIDEIQTGLGRTGTFLNIEQQKTTCDILCLAKGLGGGIPLGATLVSKDVATHIGKFYHNNTIGGNPLAMAGMLATLEEIERLKLINNARKIGDYFVDKLKKVNVVKKVRGVGLMIGIDFFNMGGIQAGELLLKNKIVAGLSGDDKSVRFLPPLIITKKEVNLIIEIMDSLQT